MGKETIIKPGSCDSCIWRIYFSIREYSPSSGIVVLVQIFGIRYSPPSCGLSITCRLFFNSVRFYLSFYLFDFKYGIGALARIWNNARNMPVYRQRWHNYEQHWLALPGDWNRARNMPVLRQRQYNTRYTIAGLCKHIDWGP